MLKIKLLSIKTLLEMLIAPTLLRSTCRWLGGRLLTVLYKPRPQHELESLEL